MSAHPVRLRRPTPELTLWTTVGVGSGVILGAAAAARPIVAIAIVGMLVVVLAAGLRIAVVPAVLSTQIFFEDTLPSYMAVIALGVAIAEWSLRRAALRPGPPLAWAGGYVLWAFASGLWAVTLDRFFTLLLALSLALCFMLVMATLISSAGDLRIVLYAISGAAFATGLYSVLQFLGGADRPSGNVGDPNTFSMYQVAALPLMVALATEERRILPRLGMLAGILVVVASVFTSLSRGGVLALAVVVFAMLLLPGSSVFHSLRQRMVVGLVVVIGAVMAFNTVSDAFIERVQNEETASGTGRANQWLASATAIRERPLLGLGYGGYFSSSNELMRRTPGVDLQRFRLAEPGYRAHSAYIGTAAELGLVGLALFLGLLGSVVLALRRTARRALRQGSAFIARTSHALIFSLLGWGVASVFLSSEASFVLWMLIGFALAMPKILERASSARPVGAATP